jgi:UDP-N-acetylmuramoyl-L-alanyl-D-glutamate--2,6-diaminopimelate ligase
VKKLFFDQLPASAFALVNGDDKNGAVMLQNTKAEKHTYALKTFADFNAKILENQFGGMLLKIKEDEVWTKLAGKFNAYNILAIYAAGNLLGLEKQENLRLISELNSVSGRFQYLVSNKKITAIVRHDYVQQ